MKLTDLPIRGADPQGAGHFGAPRGSRTHRGIDLKCEPGSHVPSPVGGEVTKIGYPYGDPNKNHIRYVQISHGDYDFRVFYVDPMVEVGQIIMPEEIIGVSQSLAEFYPGVTEHVHFEIKKGSEYVDPTPAHIMG